MSTQPEAAVDPAVERIVDPASIDVSNITPPEPQGKKKEPEQKPEDVPLTDEEAAKLTRSVVIGYYDEEYSIACRRYRLRTKSAEDKKKWVAENRIIRQKLQKLYPDFLLSDKDLDMMTEDDVQQRDIAYQILEVDGKPVTYDEALAHVRVLYPVLRGGLGQVCQMNAEKAAMYILRSIKTNLKKS